MKIGWLANTFKPIGGAEITDSLMIKAGEKKHTIIKITPKDNIPEADLYIFSNISKFPKDKLKNIYNHKPYINYFHDFEISEREDQTEIITNAKLNIFLSPLHKFEMRKFVNCNIPRTFCVPSPINPKQFYDQGNKRKGNIFVGNSNYPHKGISELRNWLDQDKRRILTHYGSGTINHSQTINHKGVAHDQMNDIYNQFSDLVFFPWIEPFARCVAEAYLAGCKINTNTNTVGFFSFNWDYSNRKEVAKKLENAPKLFWLIVTNHKLYNITHDLGVKVKRFLE